MTKKTPFTDTSAILFICLLGVFNHFLYHWSGNHPVVAAFTPVNESIWEHLKLLFFPLMFYTFVEFVFYGRNIKGFLLSRFLGVLCGMILISVGFYAYTFLLGRDLLVLDILLFVISVVISVKIGTKRIENKSDAYEFRNLSGIILFVGVTALFVGFTFYPPNAPLFYSNM